MLFEILAMWLIVVTTLVWFVRDEKARYDNALNTKALAYALVPHYRRPIAPDCAPRYYRDR